jgi:hypothetical protein
MDARTRSTRLVIRHEAARMLALFCIDDWFSMRHFRREIKARAGQKITAIVHRRIQLYLIGAMQHTHSPHRDYGTGRVTKIPKVDHDL